MGEYIKTLAMYLPQFYRTKENDEWWGKGFTDWEAVKKAEPLFEGHKQPIVPYQKKYYNLLEKDTMITQAELMKKYGIDGQCFYHYYFKDGRKVLEKPAENLLQWKDINMPFCFCWANATWSRTWSKMGGNAWADKYETNEEKEKDGILLEQKYGREEEWKKHFEYLLPFFRDERYIRKNNKPVLMIFDPLGIPCLLQMLEMWKNLAICDGLGGIYVIGMNVKSRVIGLDAVLLHAPHDFWDIRHAEKNNKVRRPDYDIIWRNILMKKPIDGCTTYFEGVTNCDDTPRRGNISGVAMKGFTIEKFKRGMQELYKKSKALGNEFVFINAWNEWGEGMHLEPDEEYGFQYLEAVRDAKKNALNSREAFDLSKMEVSNEKSQEEFRNEIMQKDITIKCLNSWLTLKEKEINIGQVLEKNGIKTIAIYGKGLLGKHLLAELEDSKVKIKYFIDSYNGTKIDTYETKLLEDDLQEVDAIVVTVVGEFPEIYNMLKEKVSYKIYSLWELISES